MQQYPLQRRLRGGAKMACARRKYSDQLELFYCSCHKDLSDNMNN